MGLNPRGGRGRGGKGNFQGKGRGGQGPPFRGGPPPGMFGPPPPPIGYSPGPPFGGPYYGGPSGSNFGQRRGGFGKFPKKNFRGKGPAKTEDTPVPEIELTKPWVTEEIKCEDAKKQECLETWRKDKNDENWSKYKAQKQVVQNLYNHAKDEYVKTNPQEAYLHMDSLRPARKYNCDTCDKTFKNEDEMIYHESEHTTCGRDGCSFTAHPKVVFKHIRMQHDSGLYTRLGKLNTKEDIAKWIEERKRRYPSQKIVEEKKALEKAKLERGERLSDDKARFNDSFSKRRKRNQHPNLKIFEKKTSSTVKKNSQKPKKEIKYLMVEPLQEKPDFRGDIPPFLGIGNISALETEMPNKPAVPLEKPIQEPLDEPVGEDNLQISDEEWQVNETPVICPEPLINRSLGLLSCYASDAEEVEEAENDMTSATTMPDKQNDDDGGSDSAPEEVKTVKSTDLPQESSEVPNNAEKVSGKKRRRVRHHDNKKSKRGRHSNVKEGAESTENNNIDNTDANMVPQVMNREPTLLKKLLSREIRHERNVILQCVRHVVKNNFFKS